MVLCWINTCFLRQHKTSLRIDSGEDKEQLANETSQRKDLHCIFLEFFRQYEIYSFEVPPKKMLKFF